MKKNHDLSHQFQFHFFIQTKLLKVIRVGITVVLKQFVFTMIFEDEYSQKLSKKYSTRFSKEYAVAMFD